MILEVCIKRILILLVVLFTTSFGLKAQITAGKIVFERKTNLKKRMGDNPRMKNFITEENKYRVENFELFFNDSNTVFRPIEDEDPVEGFLKYFTTRNTVYQNINSKQKFIEMDLFGTPGYIKDSMDTRAWKITESKRMISGYNCRKAFWQMNDSTRIYAWFSVDIVPSIGPEGFQGLPGAILGMATEDGSVVYFAKEVKAMDVPETIFQYSEKGKDIYTEKALMEELKVKMGQWVKPGDLEAMFSWL